MRCMPAIAVLAFVSLILLAGCVHLTDQNGNVVELRFKESSLEGVHEVDVVQTQKQLLKALVKGSIYETGEYVSVFGTCLNATDAPLLIGTWASLSSWYPNGSSDFVDVNMSEIQSGYYVYNGYMDPVQGTYLTEMICHVNGSVEIAKAWGEWQNPFWVKRLELLNDSLGNISNKIDNISSQMDNISVSIGNLSFNLTNSFAITWQNQNNTDVLINATYNNLTQQIIWAAGVANASVDRNDSYIVSLLNSILNMTTPAAGSVNYTEDADTVKFWKNWNIRVFPYDSHGHALSYPDVNCQIVTTLTPLDDMDVNGNHFSYTVFINSLNDFTWNVTCVWA